MYAALGLLLWTLVLQLVVPLPFAPVIIGLSLLDLVGRLLCLTVPRQTGTRGILIAAVYCQLLGIVLSIAVSMKLAPAWYDSIASTIGLLGHVLFLLFVKALSSFLSEERLVERASLVCLLSVVFALSTGVVLIGGQFDPVAGMCLPIAILVAPVYVFLYFRLLWDIRQAVSRFDQKIDEEDIEQQSNESDSAAQIQS
jgi:hypothetical protein